MSIVPIEIPKNLKEKIDKCFKDYNVPSDLLDIQAIYDNNLTEDENMRVIKHFIETLSSSKNQEAKSEADLKTKVKSVKNEKEEKERIELDNFKKEEENAKEQFDKSLEKIKFTSTDVLEKAYHITNKLIETLVKSKNINGLILLGETGIGKSYTCLKVFKDMNLKKNKDYVIISSYSTPLELYSALYEARDNKIVLLDDVMKIFENELNIGILLSALWGEGERKVDYHTSSSKLKAPPSFIFNSKIIWCVNKIPKELESIKSRCYFYELKFSYEEKIALLYELAKIKGIPFEVVEFIKDNSDELTPLDFRLLWKVYDIHENNKEEWKEIASSIIKRDVRITLLRSVLKECSNIAMAQKKYNDNLKENGFNPISIKSFYNIRKRLSVNK